MDPTKEEVMKVVCECRMCQSSDPARISREPCELGIGRNWKRLEIDVTHYKGVPYLSRVDCGPERFAIWRALANETARSICIELEQVLSEQGHVEELLMDDATAS